MENPQETVSNMGISNLYHGDSATNFVKWGEPIFLQWSLPKNCLKLGDLELLPRSLCKKRFLNGEIQTSTMESPEHTVSNWRKSNFFLGVFATNSLKLEELILLPWRLRDKLFQIRGSQTSTI